ncbi:hypothetical protein D3C87_1171640 [compost metagenome]
MMNKALSVFLPIFVAWGFLSAEERSEGSFNDVETQQAVLAELDVQEVPEDRMPAAISESERGDLTVASIETDDLEDVDLNAEWAPARAEMYENVGLTETEVLWLNEIEDVTDVNLKRVIKNISETNPKRKRTLLEATQLIVAESTNQKEEYLGTERYQYLVMARGFFLEHYRLKTGREVKVRW